METKTKNSYFDTRSLISRITIVGVFAALCFVCTSFLQISYAGGMGYFNFGDCISLLVVMFIGPLEGMLVGMLGGSMSDLFLGGANFVPFTIVAKGSMCLVTGILMKVLKNHKFMRFISPFIGMIFMVLTYVVCYYILYKEGFWLSSLFDLVQGISSSIIAILLLLPLEKSKIKNFLHL